MKLYATTTSERASKGQGGEHLNIVITDERKKVLVSIEARLENMKPVIEILDYTKGEKQKGETCGCAYHTSDGMCTDIPS